MHDLKLKPEAWAAYVEGHGTLTYPASNRQGGSLSDPNPRGFQPFAGGGHCQDAPSHLWFTTNTKVTDEGEGEGEGKDEFQGQGQGQGQGNAVGEHAVERLVPTSPQLV